MFKSFFNSLKKKKEEKKEALRQIDVFKNKFNDYVLNDFDERSYDLLISSKPTCTEIQLKDKSELIEKMLDKIFADGYISDAELAKVENIMQFMSLRNDEIPELIKLVDFMRKISLIKDGRSEPVNTNTVILRKGEFAIIEVEASLAEMVTTRHYDSGSIGLSMRLAKGLTLHRAGTRGRIISTKEEQATAEGILTITNYRVIFTSQQKAFNFNIDKLLRFSIEENNRIAFLIENRKNPNVVYVSPYNKFLVDAALVYILNNR